MIGLDTNILVRYALRDDEIQAGKVDRFIDKCLMDKTVISVSLLTIQEAEWVFRSKAKLSKSSIISFFKALLESADVEIELEDVLEEALLQFENSHADFSDCLMIANYRHFGCSQMVTFDRNAGKMEGAFLLT